MIPQFQRVDYFDKTDLLQVLCPVCRESYVHVEDAYTVEGHDANKAWDGRGDCVRVPLWGECGHAWELCFGFHKGETFVFTERIPVLEAEDQWTAAVDALNRVRARALAQ